MLGQRIAPQDWHKVAQMMPPGQLGDALGTLRRNIAGAVDRLPPHQVFIDQYMRA